MFENAAAKAVERPPEAARLESLWSGEFGRAYTERNANAGEGRAPFWESVLSKYRIRRVLEVGCNAGANLQWIVARIPGADVFGVDINPQALAQLRSKLPEVNAVHAPARDLPFRDSWFDLVFTTGVLIHQPPDQLPLAMSEIVRCSRRYVLCGEYYAENPLEVPYRGQAGALFKRDFGGMYQMLFPQLALREKGFLSRSEGWDDVTYWIFEKSE